MRVKKSSHGEQCEVIDGDHGGAYEDEVPLSGYEMSLFLDEVEDLLCSGLSVPLTSKALVDRRECLEALEVLRANLPWEMLEAKRILSEQEEVFDRAEAEAEEIKQLAERQAAFILDQSQLVKMAETRAQELIEGAEREAVQLLGLAERDARDLYQSLERELDLLMRDIKELVSARLKKL